MKLDAMLKLPRWLIGLTQDNWFRLHFHRSLPDRHRLFFYWSLVIFFASFFDCKQWQISRPNFFYMWAYLNEVGGGEM